ncbi:AAA family ATPase [Pseudomonas farsensis]|uniref:AAA family ATPase n=1 Tax=Pseudomonas farsensis TaxID=2745492 RepID=A0ABU8QVL2_9PSED
MRLHRLILDNREEKSLSIKFEKPQDGQVNFFSILIGENGTRKSRTLRDIVDNSVLMAARNSHERQAKSSSLMLWEDGHQEKTLISKVIAISGVASDRFPSRITDRSRGSLKDYYDYIGPRTENNLVSRSHGINQIALSLLTWPDRVKTRHKELKNAFSVLKVANGILFEFELTKIALEKNFDSQLRKRMDMEVGVSKYYKNISMSDISIFVSKFGSDSEVALRLDLDDEVRIECSVDNFPLVKLMLVLGLITIKNSYTYRDNDADVLPLSEFSSGQWQMLSSLLFAALSVEDNTLILIDEPENSLHPAWQQQYLRRLSAIISCVKGVHVVVATHSPLIAASLNPSISEVIQLKINRGRLTSWPITSGPFGWTSDEILMTVFGLESSRSVEFTELMDSALSLFAKGNRKNPKLIRLVETLGEMLPHLPEDDVARELIITLVGVMSKSTE